MLLEELRKICNKVGLVSFPFVRNTEVLLKQCVQVLFYMNGALDFIVIEPEKICVNLNISAL